ITVALMICTKTLVAPGVRPLRTNSTMRFARPSPARRSHRTSYLRSVATFRIWNDHGMNDHRPGTARWLGGAFAAAAVLFTAAWRDDRPTGSARSRMLESSPSQRAEAATQITFTRDIAPIIFRSCAPCHHPGEAAPFPLLTYADAKTHARQIAAVTQSRIMPPWLPDAGDFTFADDLRLTSEQISRLQAWVDQGSAEGNPEDLPDKPQFTEGWQLGKPDVIARAQKPYTLPASGSDTYWNFVFRTPVDRTRWLKAIEIRPGDKRLVHHANVLVDRA